MQVVKQWQKKLQQCWNQLTLTIKKIANRANSRNKNSNPAGVKRSEETKQRMRLAQLGKKHSEETKQKMKETRGKKNVEATV